MDPDAITWIMPNDSWLWDRDRFPPATAMTEMVGMLRVAVELDSPDEMFAALNERGAVFRLDPDVRPTKWKCATVNRAELAALRRIKRIVRLGRIEKISRGCIALALGEHRVPENSLFVDCTANGLAAREPELIFNGDRITLQSAFMCQQVFSAALIGRLETTRLSDAERNRLVTPVPHPEKIEDLPRLILASAQNMIRCGPRVPWWLRRNRLFLGHHAPLWLFVRDIVNIVRYLRRATAMKEN